MSLGETTAMRITRRWGTALVLACGFVVAGPTPSDGSRVSEPQPTRTVGLRLAQPATAVFSPIAGPGRTAYVFRVIVRLTRSLPRQAHHKIGGAMTLDGGGGCEGVVDAVPLRYRRLRAYCYEEILRNDEQTHAIRPLDDPRPGTLARIALYAGPTTSRPILVTTARLQRDRDPDPDSGRFRYESSERCVK